MASGENLTEDVDAFIYQGLGCNHIIESALELGVSEDRIHEQVVKSLRKSAISKLKECLNAKIDNARISCEQIEKDALSLGISKSEIKKEIGALIYFIN